MYVITGATGNTGKPLTLELLNAGKEVRIISRSAEKAKELTERGAKLYAGDTSDVDLLGEAFEGATAVYAMIPMDWTAEDYRAHQEKHATSIAKALGSGGVKYVVSLSTQGAHLDSGSGVALGLHRMEKMFDAIEGMNTLHLRPSYFMENTLGMVELARQAGILGSPLKGDMALPVIASRDISQYAAKRLLALDFQGHNVQDLLGARDVSYNEMARVYGAAIGRPDMQYVQFSYEDARKNFVEQMGTSESIARNMNEFVRAANEGRIVVGKRDAESTTPTTIEDFARVFSMVYSNTKN